MSEPASTSSVVAVSSVCGSTGGSRGKGLDPVQEVEEARPLDLLRLRGDEHQRAPEALGIGPGSLEGLQALGGREGPGRRR